jgi:putative transcriptional regulator
MIKNKFALLLSRKRAKESRRITMNEVARATGISRQTLYKWEDGSVERFETRVVSVLCQYFGVGIGDLLEYVEDQPTPKK